MIVAASRRLALAGPLAALLLLGVAARAARAEPRFGFSSFSAQWLGTGGLVEARAGGRPSRLAVSIALNTVVREAPEGFSQPTSVEDVRDLLIDLPRGMLADALAAPRCTLRELSITTEVEEQQVSACPAETIVGRIEADDATGVQLESPLYDLLPERGVAAELGYLDALQNPHVLYASLAPTAAGYVLRVQARELPQVALTGLRLTLYGDPAVEDGAAVAGPALLSNPTSCDGQPLVTTIYMDSWQHPAKLDAEGAPLDLQEPAWASAESSSPPVSGCGLLAGLFEPSLLLTPQTAGSDGASGIEADSPAGLALELQVPHSEGGEALAAPPLAEATLSLPQGLSVNASAANGLQGCTLAQVGMSAAGEGNAAAPECPDASKVGTVEMETPILAAEACSESADTLPECEAEEAKGGVVFRERTPLHGAVYLASPFEAQFAFGADPGPSLLGLYVVIDDPRTGVLVKLPAQLRADPHTGQLTVAILDTAPLPFSDLHIKLYSGPRALLSTPATCGSYTLTSRLTPTSAPQSGPPATPTSSFEVTRAAGGGACAASLPFAPALAAGTTSNHAGGASAFALQLARSDGEQTLAGLTLTLPPGLTANLASVTPCPESQAAAGDCPQASRIGSVALAAGAGPDPLWLGSTGPAASSTGPAAGSSGSSAGSSGSSTAGSGDAVYLTGPYDGAPFGLAIEIDPLVGPFDLSQGGAPVVVRARVEVNPQTAQLQILTDPLPQILAGIPLQLRQLDLDIERPGFILNPTSCDSLQIAGSIESGEGTTLPISQRFQVGGCAALKFSPKLTASTRARSSRRDGASLVLSVAAAARGQANLGKLEVQLPSRLPARFSTIQTACPAAQFAADPAGCPAGSNVGTAAVTTPLLSARLTGPVYFVSHPGLKFPELMIVLQGEGITLDVSAQISISKAGATSITAAALPDMPFTSFTLTLPEGPHSALAAPRGKLCRDRLALPTTLTGQNGAVLRQRTRIQVEGCSKKLELAKHHRSGRELILKVYVPAAGRVKASARGLTSQTKKTKDRATLTFWLHEQSRRPRHTKLRLVYRPRKGKKQLVQRKLRLER